MCGWRDFVPSGDQSTGVLTQTPLLEREFVCDLLCYPTLCRGTGVSQCVRVVAVPVGVSCVNTKAALPFCSGVGVVCDLVLLSYPVSCNCCAQAVAVRTGVVV